MKALKYISFLLCCTLFCTSCENKAQLPKGTKPLDIDHYLWISFRDASGKDLVKGIEYGLDKPDTVPANAPEMGGINSDLYTLKAIFPEGAFDTTDKSLWGCSPCDSNVIFPEFSYIGPPYYDSMGNYYYVRIRTFSIPEDDVKMLTYLITCPYIFGDDSVHEIVTYWRLPTNYKQLFYKACDRIVFDGKECNNISYEDYEQISLATIKTERK